MNMDQIDNQYAHLRGALDATARDAGLRNATQAQEQPALSLIATRLQQVAAQVHASAQSADLTAQRTFGEAPCSTAGAGTNQLKACEPNGAIEQINSLISEINNGLVLLAYGLDRLDRLA
jgi:hypothetical protein